MSVTAQGQTLTQSLGHDRSNCPVDLTQTAADISEPAIQVDPAIIIGLAMIYGRQGGLPNIPDILLAPLYQAAMSGCAASKMVLNWLERSS